jgi:hypothetical protein
MSLYCEETCDARGEDIAVAKKGKDKRIKGKIVGVYGGCILNRSRPCFASGTFGLRIVQRVTGFACRGGGLASTSKRTYIRLIDTIAEYY